MSKKQYEDRFKRLHEKTQGFDDQKAQKRQKTSCFEKKDLCEMDAETSDDFPKKNHFGTR